MAAKFREKRTLITTVRDQCLSYATFLTPLIFHYPLPLNPFSLLVQDLFNSSPFMHSMDDFEMFGGGAFPSGSGQRTRRSQQTCRTVTQKVGNKLTTYTRCS
jgi:hypothetical protein